LNSGNWFLFRDDCCTYDLNSGSYGIDIVGFYFFDTNVGLNLFFGLIDDCVKKDIQTDKR